MKKSFSEHEHNAWFNKLREVTWRIEDGGRKAASELPHLIRDAPGQDVEETATKYLAAVTEMLGKLEELKSEIKSLSQWG